MVLVHDAPTLVDFSQSNSQTKDEFGVLTFSICAAATHQRHRKADVLPCRNPDFEHVKWIRSPVPTEEEIPCLVVRLASLSHLPATLVSNAGTMIRLDTVTLFS